MSDLFLPLDRDRGSLGAQVTAGLRNAVRDGRLTAGTRLPSTRALAADLGVSRGLVVDAYEQLVAEGYLTSRSGSGTQVADIAGAARHTRRTPAPAPAPTGGPGRWTDAGAPARTPTTGRPGRDDTPTAIGRDGTAPAAGPAIVFDLKPGTPDLALFPRAAWLAATRHVLGTAPHAAFGYPGPSGTTGLRTALSAHLGRVRAASAAPEEVVIVNGVAQGLSLVSHALHRLGHRELAVEDPSGTAQRGIFTTAGLRVVDVPVDAEGIDVAALDRTGARAVLVTPAHQFPTGVVLSPGRRAALLSWAVARDGLVLEDDYDAEFRYDRDPVGCLQGLAPDRVVHLGSASKALIPGMRLGWAVVPGGMLPEIRELKTHSDLGSPVLSQLALAHMLDTGVYDRHLRGTRKRYRARRDAVVAELATRLPGARVHGIAAGLHVYVELPPGCDEARTVRGARERGVRLEPVSPMLRSGPRPPAVVLGYGALGADRLREAVRRIADAANAAHTAHPTGTTRPRDPRDPRDPTGATGATR